MTAPEYAPQNAAEATLVAVWPGLAPLLLGRARKQFLTSPWAHEAQERAEEKTQDAFERCLKAARSGAWDGANPKQYIGTVANNVVVDTLRQQRFRGAAPTAVAGAGDGEPAPAERAFEALLVDARSPEAAVVGGAEAVRWRATLGLAFEALPLAQRHALWLRYFNRLGLEDVGRSLGLGYDQTRRLLRAAGGLLARAAAHEARQRRAGRPDLAARLREKMGPPDARGCRPWYGSMSFSGRRPGRRGPSGEPVPNLSIGWGGRNQKKVAGARRVLWALHHGPVDPWSRVVAACGRPDCVAEAHLAQRAGLSDRRSGPTPAPDPEPLPDGPPPQATPLGAELLAWRRAAGLHRPALAALAGVTWQAVKALELHSTAGTGLDGRRRLATALAAWAAARPAASGAPPWTPEPNPAAGAAFAARRTALRQAPSRGRGDRVTRLDVSRESGRSPCAVQRLEAGLPTGRVMWDDLWGALVRLEARCGTREEVAA